MIRCSIHQHREALVSQLAGQPCVESQPGRVVIPLLLPESHNLPFAVAVEVTHRPCNARGLSAAVDDGEQEDAYELQHILAGSGLVTDHAGHTQKVVAGDSLLLRHGMADVQVPEYRNQNDPLVALKLLIPASLLTDTADMSVAKETAARMVKQWGSLDASQTLPPSVAAMLLSQASASIRTHTKPPAQTTNPFLRLIPSSIQKSFTTISTLAQDFLSPNTQLATEPAISEMAAVTKRSMADLLAFQLPNQTNRLALAFGPDEVGLRLSFGVEIFNSGHQTPPHIHTHAHELFFVLLGSGVAFCGDDRFPVSQGDCVVFPPLSVHGIDNFSSEKLYCLQIMLPNEMFVEFVKSGKAVGRLSDEDLCNLIAVRCSSM